MQKVILLLLGWICLTGLPLQSVSQAARSEKKLLVRLGAGERLLTDRSCFLPGAQAGETFLLTRDTSGYFEYTNGKKAGPFKEEALSGQRGCDSTRGEPCARARWSNTRKESLMASYIGTDGQFSSIIRHKGKKYGPYQAVMQFDMSEDESSFAAIVMEQDARVRLVHSSGRSVLLQGTPYFLLLSPDGRQALAGMGKTIDATDAGMNNLDIADLMSYEIFDLEGKRFGPFRQDEVGFDQIWFCTTGGSNWFLLKGEEIYRNGTALRKIQAGIDPCGLWFHPDGKRAAMVVHGQGARAESPDTWFIHDPLLINGRLEAGKVVLDWISLENGKDLLLHRMSF